METPQPPRNHRLPISPSALQFIKYACVGVINTLVTFFVIFLCKSVLGVNPWLSNALGYAAGIVNSFLWNKRWVFCTSGHYLREAVIFLSGALVCYVVQLLALWLLVNETGLRTWQCQLWSFTLSGYGIATVLGNIVYTVAYYIYNKLITFRQ